MLFCEFHSFSPQTFFSSTMLMFFLYALTSHQAKLLFIPPNTMKLHVLASLRHTSVFSLFQKSILQTATHKNIHSVMPIRNVLLNSRWTIFYLGISWGLTYVRMNEVYTSFSQYMMKYWGTKMGADLFLQHTVMILPSESYNQGLRAWTSHNTNLVAF